MKDPPQGVIPPSQNHTPRKATHQPNRLRKFVAPNSAGLRVRSHPSLQSEQLGVVDVNGTIAFIDEVTIVKELILETENKQFSIDRKEATEEGNVNVCFSSRSFYITSLIQE